MKVEVTKIGNNGNIGIRDYLVNQAIENNEQLIVTFNNEKMALSPLELKRGDIGSKQFESKIDDKSYRIIYYKWNPINEVNPLVNKLGESWAELLKDEFKKPYMKHLSQWVSKRREIVRVCPEPEDVFNAFKLTPYDKVKVVILGSSPNNSLSVINKVTLTNGLAYSVKVGSSQILERIFEEIKISEPHYEGKGDLTRWAEQGVFLLNTILTVDKGKALSHEGQGWEQFTLEVIRTLDCHYNRLIVMLWGNEMQEYAKYFSSKHTILKAPHPLSSLYNPNNSFIGCGHFSQCNEILEKQNQTKIEW